MQSAAERPEGYGRRSLPDGLKASYDTVWEAVRLGQASVDLPFVEENDLAKIMTYLRRDFPELSGLASEYSYRSSPALNRTTVAFTYNDPGVRPFGDFSAVEEAAKVLLSNIPPSLSAFDKAVIVHDRLVSHISYDKDAPRASLLAGALCDRRASCDGYAKAYQYLLQQLGIDALIVYGDAGGAHAWNIIKLDDGYYNADITWDDAKLDDGTEFVSHEYLFLDDARFLKSHTPLSDGSNYPLPSCSSMAENYFSKHDLMLSGTDKKAVEKALSAAVELAAANKSQAVQIGLSDTGVLTQLENTLIGDGTLDRFVQKRAVRKGAEASGRTVSNSGLVLTYIIKYKD